jgi:catecholate siderophore receptor
MRILTLPLCALATLSAASFPVAAQVPVTHRDSTLRKSPGQPAVIDTTSLTTLAPVRVVETRRAVYAASRTTTATKTATLLRDVPQAMTVVGRDLIRDAGMQGMADVVRFVPGVTMGQGEGNRDQPTIRGNSSTADFFVDGVRDDVQYLRDLYNVEQVEALKGSNAMIFGRAGGGGVLNRVTKEAQWAPVRELLLQGGSFDNKRGSLDVGGGFSRTIAARLNAMYERSGVFRNGVTLRRSGVNPTVTVAAGARTRVAFAYEYFTDHRTADRGIPSFGDLPIGSDIATFFGDPAVSYADVRVHAAAATVALEAAHGLTIHNRSRFAAYDKIYQNVFPGAVNAAGDEVSISAYNNGTRRHNLFNQTDLTSVVSTGSVRHTLLVGAEVGRQSTDNLRNTGYFNGAEASVSVPVRSPTISMPVAFRQSTTDADNHVVNGVASLYAQDQVRLSAHWQLIAGVRYERFDVRYHNNRTDSTLRRVDRMISPRAGVLFKPMEPLSFYVSHSGSYLPSAGDQFSSLTNVSKALEPERFTNHEVGAKWDVADRLALTAAAYRLDRTNTRAPDPTDPARTLQTGSQRTNGFELGVNGSVTPAWEIAGGYANQDAFIASTTTAAPTGARAPLVPRHTLSLWNRYQLSRRFSVAIGVIHRSDMYAAIDDKVTLPSFVELDGAVYLSLARGVRVQANLENLFDARYYVTATGNNNISPGSPRAVRVTVASGF